MKTLSDFSEHYRGFDASLAVSLFDQGFIFSRTDPKSEGDLRIWANFHGYGVFDWADFKNDLNFWREFNWIQGSSREAFLSFLGVTLEEFNLAPLEQKLFDAILYFGAENICGTPYHGSKILREVSRN